MECAQGICRAEVSRAVEGRKAPPQGLGRWHPQAQQAQQARNVGGGWGDSEGRWSDGKESATTRAEKGGQEKSPGHPQQHRQVAGTKAVVSRASAASFSLLPEEAKIRQSLAPEQVCLSLKIPS